MIIVKRWRILLLGFILALGWAFAAGSILPKSIDARTNQRSFSDSFSRADTPLGSYGVSDSGTPWALTGNGIASADVQAHHATIGHDSATPLAVYAYVALSGKPQQMTGSVSFVPGTGPDQAVVAMISSSDASLLSNMGVHLGLTPSGWFYMVRQAGGEFVVLGSGPFTVPLRVDGTSYSIKIAIDQAASQATLTLPDGVHTVTDPRIAALSGPYLVWEQVSYPTGMTPRWDAVSAQMHP